MKKFLSLLLCLVICLVLAGCGAGRFLPTKDDNPSHVTGDDATPMASPDADGPVNLNPDGGVGTPAAGAPAGAEDINFGLQLPQDPGFDDGVDLTNTPDYTGQLEGGGSDSDPMYIEQDGYAYLLDPMTLQPTGGPLDPVTHLPVNIDDPSATGGDADTDSEATEGDGEHASAEEPTEQTKYPNTGIFLEDD